MPTEASEAMDRSRILVRGRVGGVARAATGDQFQIHGRQDRPCRSCGATIRELVGGGRGTHVCPRCQR